MDVEFALIDLKIQKLRNLINVYGNHLDLKSGTCEGEPLLLVAHACHAPVKKTKSNEELTYKLLSLDDTSVYP